MKSKHFRWSASRLLCAASGRSASDVWSFGRTGVALLAMGIVFLPSQAIAQQIAPVWVVSAVAGNLTDSDTGDGGQATSATIEAPHGVAVDKAGNIYFSEADDVIRMVTPSGVISTIAGTPNVVGVTGDGGQATAALLDNPYGVEIDRDGNLLIGDEASDVIRKINLSSGIITGVAGTPGVAGYAGDGAIAINATLHTPFTAASDSAGNVYIADYANHVIRKVDTSGNISTFAGTGTAGNNGDNGPALSAELDEPYSVWVDPAGNLYIDDVGVSVTRMVDTSGIIHTIAGNGTKGNNGTGMAATNTEFSTQHGVVIDGLGNTYIADEGNQVIRMINASGVVSNIAGTGTAGSTGNGGPALAGKTDYPYGLAIDSSNNLYTPEALEYRIRKFSLNTEIPSTAVASATTQNLFVASSVAVTPSTATFSPSTEFTVGTLAGCSFGAQLAASAPCTMPITFTPTAPGLQTASLIITDASGNISTIGLSGVGTAPQVSFGSAAISTIAGNGTAGYSGAAGAATSAEVSAPRGGVVDSAGNIYFADSGNNVIRRIDAISGAITTVAGTGSAGYSGDGAAATSAQLDAPAKVVLDAAGDLYIADTGNNVIRYVNSATGVISTIAGNGTSSYTGDGGAATAATLNHPQGLAVDLGSHVYVADTGNNVIRYFGVGGQISTFVGNGTAGYSGDKGNAHDAELNAPEAVVLDQQGDVYIADTGNDVLRLVSARNQITTIAGQQGQNTNSGDGGVATTATLANPSDIAMDAAGDLYIAADGQVRIINASGAISTIAGTGASGAYSGEGGAATDAVIPSPANNVLLDNAGNLYISDTAGNVLLKVTSATSLPIAFGTQRPGSPGSTQRVTVLNNGNSKLQFSAITVSSPFTLQSGDPTACTSTTALAPGQSCSLTVAFNPTVVGPFSGTITLTDNALNVASSTQTINLTGNASIINATTIGLVLSPTSPVYGQTTQAIATATLMGGVSATGTVAFTLNGVSIGKPNLTGTSVSINLPVLQAGPVTLTASYSGDSTNSSSSSSISFTVQPAVLTITATNLTKYYSDPNPALTYTSQGYANGDTASAITGSPVLSTTATENSAVGTYPITLTAGTLASKNYTFVLVPGTLTIQPAPPPTFSLSVTPTTVVMEDGGSATATVSLTSLYGYTGTAQFSCSSTTGNIGCSFNPASITGDPSAPNRITTTQMTLLTGSVYASTSEIGYPNMLLVLVLLPLALLLLRRRKGMYATLFLSLIALVVASGVSGCTIAHSSLPPTGTSQVTITATDSASHQAQSTTFSVTIL